jgi:rhodanese-related sulfurtransferase
MKEITVEELKKKIENSEPFTFLDVREQFETYLSDLDIETILIPVEELKNRLSELDKNSEIIVMCRSGNRSGKACELLEEKGFQDVKNLKGGINEWASKIDPNLPVY